MVAAADAEGGESPAALVATTRYVYVVPGVSPESLKIVAPEVVPAVVQLAPPVADRSTR